jgi:hypothetical protein
MLYATSCDAEETSDADAAISSAEADSSSEARRTRSTVSAWRCTIWLKVAVSSEISSSVRISP